MGLCQSKGSEKVAPAKLGKSLQPVLLKEVDIQRPDETRLPSVTGSTFLQDSKLLLVDGGNQKLKILGKSFQFIEEKCFESSPEDVAVSEKNEVAVSFPDMNKISLLSVDDDIKETVAFRTPSGCISITYLNRDTLLGATGGNGGCIYIIKTDGTLLETLDTLPTPNILAFPSSVRLNAGKSVIYLANPKAQNVCAVSTKDYDVNFVSRYESFVSPSKIVVHPSGNVFAIAKNERTSRGVIERSTVVHQISPKGEHLGILPNMNVGQSQIGTLTFNPIGNVLVVGRIDNKLIQVYKI